MTMVWTWISKYRTRRSLYRLNRHIDDGISTSFGELNVISRYFLFLQAYTVSTFRDCVFYKMLKI